MSLNWSLEGCEDWEALKTDEEWPITQTLIFATMGVGIGEITEKTLPEFYARIAFLERLNGSFVKAQSEDGSDWVDRPITVEDIRRRIGLTTNVFPQETRAKWAKRQADMALTDLVRTVSA